MDRIWSPAPGSQRMEVVLDDPYILIHENCAVKAPGVDY